MLMRNAIIAAIGFLAQPVLAWAEAIPSAIVAKKVGAGWVFTDKAGMSLYTSAQDKPGQSKCQGPCAKVWPPVLATSEAETVGSAEWSVVKRGDGVSQIAFRGMPLYTYAQDSAPGTTFGEGIANAWEVARRDMDVPAGIAINRNGYGRALTDTHGKVLYFNAGDKPQPQKTAVVYGKAGIASVAQLKSACTKRCLESWKPLRAPSVAVADGDWSIVEREDGLRQWAYQQKPLYVPIGEIKLEQRQDQPWHTALIEAPPPVPPWVTYQNSDAGEVLADSAGFVIYALTTEKLGVRLLEFQSLTSCVGECVRTYWRPIAAAADAKPVGNWTIVKGFDGVNQWAYKGEMLFIHARDREPGELAGSRFFTRAWHTLTRSGEDMEGMDKRG